MPGESFFIINQNLLAGAGECAVALWALWGAQEFWTVRGSNAIIALRCCHLNGRFEDYREQRRVT